MENQSVVLETQGLTKYFGGTRACYQVDMELYRGEVLAVVGDNGAGKSTLIKMLTGVHRPDEGKILLDGVETSFADTRSAMDKGVRAVYQNLGLVDSLDAAGNVFLGNELYRRVLGIDFLDNRKMKEEVVRVLDDTVGVVLADVSQPVFNLSGGQRQAVAIGRTTYGGDLRVLVLDEPVAALGPQETQRTLELVRRLKGKNMGIIFIAHNLEHVFAVADRVLVMQRGMKVGERAIADSSRQEVLGLIVGVDSVDAIQSVGREGQEK